MTQQRSQFQSWPTLKKISRFSISSPVLFEPSRKILSSFSTEQEYAVSLLSTEQGNS